jgi:hypothetical protein
MALIVGLDKYQHQPRQPGAVRNADAMSSCLRWKYKFEVATLADQQATRGALSRELTRLGDADRAVIYYAGRALDDDTLCLYGTDADLANSGLSVSRLLRQLDAMPCQHILVIIDAALDPLPMIEPLPPSGFAALDERANGNTRIVLASGKTAFTTHERWGDEDATPFTAQVIHGLRGAAANPDENEAITALLLAEHLAEELPRNSNGKAESWSGWLPGSTGDLVFRDTPPLEFPYDIEKGLRSGTPFHRYRSVELLAYLIDRGDPVLSVAAIDRLREVALDNDSANVRKMAVDELFLRNIDPKAGDVPALREPLSPRSDAPDMPPPSNTPAPPLPEDKRQTVYVYAVMVLVFAIVLFLMVYFR